MRVGRPRPRGRGPTSPSRPPWRRPQPTPPHPSLPAPPQVRARAQELRRTLDDLARALAFSPATLSWPAVVEKCAVAGAAAGGVGACVRPLAAAYVAHPTAVSGANAALLPVMLSSRRLPEMEAAAARVAAAAVAAVAPGAAGRPGELYAALGTATDALNAVVDYLTVAGGVGDGEGGDAPGKGALDPRGARRRALAASLHASVQAGSGGEGGGGEGSRGPRWWRPRWRADRRRGD